jgi:DNA-binding transcriptional regulator LsrR (DeoR family)
MENETKKILKSVEIAQMYYEQTLAESEISERPGVSRPLVSRMLNEGPAQRRAMRKARNSPI